MNRKEEAFAHKGLYWDQLRSAVQEGVRDLRSGFDRVAFDWFDPRVEGGLTLGFALTRALASFWRVAEGVEAMPVQVLAGTFAGGDLNVRTVPLDRWPALDGIHLAADGPVAVTEREALTRRMRVDDGRPVLHELFGGGEVPGDLILVCGTLGGEAAPHLLTRAARMAGQGAEGAAILLLYQGGSGPVDIEDAGGPSRNCWHPGLSASLHMSDSHASGSYLRLMQEEGLEVWYDQAFRDRLFAGLQAAAAQQGLNLTNRAFLDALAEGSPLRRVLPHHLTRFFPEAERLFWCVPEGGLDGIDPLLWDPSSPLERLAILSAVKTAAGG